MVVPQFMRTNVTRQFRSRERIVPVLNRDACTVNAFKARLDKFWKHQSVKFDFTADLTGTGNRSEEVIK